MWKTVVKLGLSEGLLKVGPGSISVACAYFLEHIPYGEMSFLALLQMKKGLILPQSNVPNFIDSP